MLIKTKNTIVIIAILAISCMFYYQNNFYNQKISKTKEKNKQKINRINNNFKKEKDSMNNIILSKESEIMQLNWDVDKLKEYLNINNNKRNVIEEINQSPNYMVTAYDLSVQSCGKTKSSNLYGITASGKNLTGLDLRTASTISTDPKIIPLGSIVYLYFENKNAKQYNGIYVSNDTGSAIKGNKIDLFFGDFDSNKPSPLALNFGKQSAKVIYIE